MAGKISFDGPDDDSFDLQPIKIETVNVLVAGLTGSGKSSIIKAICAGDQVDVQMSPNSVTTNLTMYANNLIVNPNPDMKRKKYTVNLFDTVGLGDNNVNVPTILRQIVEFMPKYLSTVHKIVFCFKMDRLRKKMSEELNMFCIIFLKWLVQSPKTSSYV
jgi:predicted GTPase